MQFIQHKGETIRVLPAAEPWKKLPALAKDWELEAKSAVEAPADGQPGQRWRGLANYSFTGKFDHSFYRGVLVIWGEHPTSNVLSFIDETNDSDLLNMLSILTFEGEMSILWLGKAPKNYPKEAQVKGEHWSIESVSTFDRDWLLSMRLDLARLSTCQPRYWKES